MKGFLRRLKSAIWFATGADRLTDNFLKFALMHLTYVVATSITMTFVNTLLMRVSTDANVALKYNIVHFVFVGSSMLVANFITHRFGQKVTIYVAVFFSMLTYILVFVLMNTLDFTYPIVAITHGIATGLYWITYFDNVIEYTTDNTRDVAMNFIGVFSGIISLVMPLISGIIISAFVNFSGYYIVFGFCGGVALLAVMCVFRLPSQEADREKTKFKLLMKKIYTKKVWFYVIHMDFFKGMREGAFSFFLNVLLFSMIQSEAIIGANNFLTGVASIVSCFVAGRLVRPNNRLKLMVLSIGVMATGISILFFAMNPVTILLVSVFSSFLGVFMINPTTTTLYEVFDNVEGADELRKEAFGVTECYKNTGRIVGVVLIMVMPIGNIYSIISLLVLVLVQFITVLLAKLTKKHIKLNLIEQGEK